MSGPDTTRPRRVGVKPKPAPDATVTPPVPTDSKLAAVVTAPRPVAPPTRVVPGSPLRPATTPPPVRAVAKPVSPVRAAPKVQPIPDPPGYDPYNVPRPAHLASHVFWTPDWRARGLESPYDDPDIPPDDGKPFWLAPDGTWRRPRKHQDAT